LQRQPGKWRNVPQAFAEEQQRVRKAGETAAGRGHHVSARDHFLRASMYCREVSGPVTARMFTAAEGADMHCQVGNLSLSNAVVYDWLSEIFSE
jgi:hypothetical protein